MLQALWRNSSNEKCVSTFRTSQGELGINPRSIGQARNGEKTKSTEVCSGLEDTTFN